MYLGKIETGKPIKKILIIFLLAALIITAGVIYISLAKAIITLFPKQAKTTVDFELKAKDNYDQKNEIYGRQLVKEIERVIIFTEVDKKDFPDFASGTVTVYNQRDQDQPLLATTQLKAVNGVIFRTQKRVVVPAGGQAQVEVVADGEGEVGNIEPGKLTVVKIWPAWQNQIFAENKEKFTGGLETKPFVSETTLARAKETLASQFFDEIKQDFEKNLKPGEIISEKTVVQEVLNFDPKIKLEKQTDGTQGKQIDRVTVGIKVKVKAVTFDQAKARQIAEERLKTSIPSGNEFLEILPDSLNFKITDINEETKITTITFHLEGNTRLKLPLAAFDKKALLGRDYGEIINYYRGLNEVDKIGINFSPFWVSTIPSGEEKIEIKVSGQPN